MSQSRQEVLALISRKDEMVAELDGLLTSLDDQNVGMSRTLTTFDGYPRDDIDIPLIRSQRQKVYILQNDIKDILEKIRVGLLALLSEDQNPAESDLSQLQPFCYVAQVDTPSGLEINDEIIKFGSIDETNNNGLRALAGQLHKKPLKVAVKRNGEVLELELKVTEGKLGARVLPVRSA